MLNRISSPISSFVNSNGFLTPTPTCGSTNKKRRESQDVKKNFSPIITFKKANIMPSLKPIEIKSYSF